MTITTRETLAEIALDLFARKGFRETSIGDIEEAAGLKRRAGGFYRHFPSKEAVLIEGVERMATEMIAEIRLDDVVKQKSVRAELVFMAKKLLAHAAKYRVLRLLLQREAHKMPTLRNVMERANKNLASQDIVPWTEYALRRAGIKEDPRSFAFVIFGSVVLYVISQDRNQPAFGLSERRALNAWADYWAAQLEPGRESG